MRSSVRTALGSIASRFSDDAPSIDVSTLTRRYGALAGWPADAELGLLVLAWVLGSGFSIQGFREALAPPRLVPDFRRAGAAIGRGGSPSLITLGGIARGAFENAGVVLDWNFHPEILYWPMQLPRLPGTLPRHSP